MFIGVLDSVALPWVPTYWPHPQACLSNVVLLLEAIGSGSLTEDSEGEVTLEMEYQSQRSYEGGIRGELGKASGGSLRLFLLLRNILLLLETADSSKKV